MKWFLLSMFLACGSLLTAQTHVISGTAQSADADIFAGEEVSLTTLEEFRNFDPEGFMSEIQEFWTLDSVAVKLTFKPKEPIQHPNGTTFETDDISVIVSGPFETIAPRLAKARDGIVNIIDRITKVSE